MGTKKPICKKKWINKNYIQSNCGECFELIQRRKYLETTVFHPNFELAT